MIKAVIFDMDGVLIDSEPLWRKMESRVYQAMGLPVTEKTFLATTGVRLDMAVEKIYEMFPWGKIPTKEEVVERILSEMEKAIGRNRKASRHPGGGRMPACRTGRDSHGVEKPVKPCEGVIEALALCQKKGVKLALASSSPMRLINVTLQALQLTQSFSVIHSGEFEEHPKPAPDIYLTTAHMLKVIPAECIAIEDSPVGIESATRAGMRCIAIVDPHHKDDPRYEIADIRLHSLKELDETLWNRLNKLSTC